MPGIYITSVSCSSQRGATTLFDFMEDGLNLAINVRLSQKFYNTRGAVFTATFEIIDFLTNQVVVSREFSETSVKFRKSPAFQVNMGNTWSKKSADWTTPQKWGLQIDEPKKPTLHEIFGFRGAVLGYQRSGTSILRVDAFDVSDILWFRVIP